MHYAHANGSGNGNANGSWQLALKKIIELNYVQLHAKHKKQKQLKERAKYCAAATTCHIAMVHSLSTTLANTAKL